MEALRGYPHRPSAYIPITPHVLSLCQLARRRRLATRHRRQRRRPERPQPRAASHPIASTDHSLAPRWCDATPLAHLQPKTPFPAYPLTLGAAARVVRGGDCAATPDCSPPPMTAVPLRRLRPTLCRMPCGDSVVGCVRNSSRCSRSHTLRSLPQWSLLQWLIMGVMLVLSARRVFWLSVRSEKFPILRSLKNCFHRSSSLPPSWSCWKSEIESR